MGKFAVSGASTETDLRARYLAMLSHDVRSAISGVIGGLQQIPVSRLDNDSQKHLEGAIAAASDLSRLFDGVLDMEAIEKSEFELDLEPATFEDLLGELYRRWNGPALKSGLELVIEYAAGGESEFIIDHRRISRVLGNIIENSVKNAEKGSIRVSAKRNPDMSISFVVRDDGPGFSDAALDLLFSFRGRPDNSAKPGSGLGLYIAHTLLAQMGGTIDARNHPDGGAVVEITVPAQSEDRQAEPPEWPENPASVAVLPSSRLPDLSHLNIILAEDNTTNQLVVTQMLDAMGARFSVASDGVEALNLFETQNYDLALLDIEMPRLSGLEVIRAIRARKDDRSMTPIVALTAYAMREHRERISAAGADGLIAKPILGIEDLGNALLNYYRRHSPKANATDPAQSDDNATSRNVIIDEAIYESLRSSIGHEKMSELLGKVITDLGNVRDGIEHGIAEHDVKRLRTASHILISVAGAIGAVKTQHLAEALNKAANEDDVSEIRRCGTLCLTSIDDLLTVVSTRTNA